MSDPYTARALLAAEADIRRLHGVVGFAALDDDGGDPREIQVFTSRGVDVRSIREQVSSVLAAHGLLTSVQRIYVFEVAAHPPADPAPAAHPHGASHAEAADTPGVPSNGADLEGRVVFRRVAVSTGGERADAEVALGRRGAEHVGSSQGRPTAQNLFITAAATIDAVEALVGRPGRFTVEGAAIVEVLGHPAVCVVVQLGRERHIGASLTRDDPVHEAVVRAGLDAVNRALAVEFHGGDGSSRGERVATG